jgi:hypothetical protein
VSKLAGEELKLAANEKSQVMSTITDLAKQEIGMVTQQQRANESSKQ